MNIIEAICYAYPFYDYDKLLFMYVISSKKKLIVGRVNWNLTKIARLLHIKLMITVEYFDYYYDCIIFTKFLFINYYRDTVLLKLDILLLKISILHEY